MLTWVNFFFSIYLLLLPIFHIIKLIEIVESNTINQ